ncbi:MAG TPA: NAD-dependent epimerase/dehydratase family protein [Verrucomicrobiota bacterium]|nr:NAD-dependent epimerase/dehydratase family protein [Verrucomicrobiota bacterium]HNT13513.1 NAD-dependent epimerase/dehydratase family protein [Verrucomicrobiota bacterium]
MRILITGGAGFIGSHIVEHFQKQAEIIVMDNLRSGRRSNLNGLEHRLVEASILDRTALREALRGVDYVFHLAAMISVPESMTQPIECNRLNTEGTLVVLEEAARAGVKKLVFSSSAAVYGNDPTSPKSEALLPSPESPYAVSKLDGEYYCKIFAQAGRLASVCLRYFNVFGPRQDPASQYAAAVPIFMHRAVRHQPITIFGDGEQTRDFVYVKDVAAANAFFARNTVTTGIFNVAYGATISINALARRICQLTGSRSVLSHQPERIGDVKHSLAAVDRLRAAGFRPTFNLEHGLAATVAHVQAAQDAARPAAG